MGGSRSYKIIKLRLSAGKWVVATLQGDKSASQSSMELDYLDILGASQMTTNFWQKKLAKDPIFIVMEFPRKKKNSVFGQFSVKFPPPATPSKNAHFINIVVSVSLIFGPLRVSWALLAQRALRDRLMSRGKNCLPTVSRQFLTRNYPRPNCLLRCLPNCLSPTREGFFSFFQK